jgi:hypothetical protein
MKKILSALLILILGITTPQTLFAAGFDTFKPSSWTKKETYADKTTDKLGFGLLNITMGWTAIPFEIDKHKESNPYTGLAKGLWRTLTNTAGGALHAATFPIPLDIPLPDGGVSFE